MEIVHTDSVVRVAPGTTPDYDANNPLVKLLHLIESTVLAGERMWYEANRFQYLVPIRSLSLYGPQGNDADVVAPMAQDNKTDFQKQNVKDFVTGDTILVRGIVSIGSWSGPFLRLSYAGGPETPLATAAQRSLGAAIRVWIKIGDAVCSAPIQVPYNPRSHRYDIEYWGYPGQDLRGMLGPRTAAAFDRGELVVNLGLVHGDANAFAREGLDGRLLREIAPTDTIHPILPLRVELAWATEALDVWDSQGGRNYVYVFNMLQRGWDRFLSVGASSNPHGGVGFLEYRNLLSNYGAYAGMKELSRHTEPWMFNAFNTKGSGALDEPFMAVDYLDLHVLKANCGIGLHRHRDNAEIFFMIGGRGFMVVGDWCKFPERERCFEIRTMRSGDLVMLRGGNLHALMNATDEEVSLLMFGGYD
jgi:mannose-6-phosphate isomerase-like protein (cupin superfamily)